MDSTVTDKWGTLEDSFQKEIESVRNYLKTRLARAHQVLHELEKALLSELQQLEDSYRGEIKLRANPETARDRDRIKRVRLERDRNLEVILRKASSIRVEVSDYSVEEISTILAHTTLQALSTSEASSKAFANANKDNTLSKQKVNQSIPPIRIESRMDIPQISNSTFIKNGEEIGAKNTQIDSYSKNNQRDPTTPINSSIEPSYSPQAQCKPASTSTTVPYDTNFKYTMKLSITPVIPITSNKCTDKPTCTSSKYMEKCVTNTSHSNTANIGSHKSNNDPMQSIRNLPEDSPTRGLRNLGNTCYMNCILQCLSHTLPLRQFYVTDEYRQYLNNRGDLSNAFKCVMLELWSTTLHYSLGPYYLKRELKTRTDKFPHSRQHDAHEFMRFLLNELHEEINRASVEGRKSPADNETLGEACTRYLTWEDSRISELFGGMLRSEVCCSICSNQSITYSQFMDIALPIPEIVQRSYHLYSISPGPSLCIDDCLSVITAKENLITEDRPYCNNCSELTNATKQLSIAKLPKFLAIQLKRFSYHPEHTKLSTPVEFDDTWQLADRANKINTYSLYGIVCHSGSISGGHYTAYCKYRDVWRCFNDDWVYNVSWEQVKHQEAYILFYKQSVCSPT